GKIPGQGGMSAHPAMPEPIRSALKWHSFGPLSRVPEWKPNPGENIPGYKGWIMYRKPFRYLSDNDRDLMPDELNAEWVIKILQQKHDKPFFLAVGFNRPHTPLYAPKKYFDMFPPEKLRLPPYKMNDARDCARILWDPGHPERPNPYGWQRYKLVMEAGGIEMWRRWIQAYLACVAFVDHQVGKILDDLQARPYADNTIVIFTSDHGYHMGEKDYLFKNSVWEESARVPLVIAAPGVSKANSECDHPVSLVDMYPTLIDLCGLTLNPNKDGNNVPLDGHSIRPFIEEPNNGTWDGPSVTVTAIASIDRLKINEPAKPKRQHYTARSKQWRYVLCNNGEEELYDQRKDPQEWTNLAGYPEYAETKKKLRDELLKLTGRKN
ncbi:MAG: sulfatase-like hydrolase/transferase, partial [Planctomycetota bacterium]